MKVGSKVRRVESPCGMCLLIYMIFGVPIPPMNTTFVVTELIDNGINIEGYDDPYCKDIFREIDEVDCEWSDLSLEELVEELDKKPIRKPELTPA